MLRKPARPAILCLIALFTSAAEPAQAVAAATACRDAAAQAATRHGVPEDVLLTIATIESGRGNEAGWPWTVGHRGRGHWAATAPEAISHAADLIAAGERNLDIGCFQINVHWHAPAFPSLAAMFDPQANADHAARLLAGHYARLGTWQAAVAAFHSRSPARAAQYLARFEAAWAAGPAPPDTPPDAPSAEPPDQRAPHVLIALIDDGSVAQTAGSLVRPGRLGRSLIGAAP